MGFWSKLGKIGLTVAPYVAAPFTGGASLAFAPAANRAVSAWNAKDARKNAEKGLGPSRTDQFISMAGDVAGGLSNTGALGKFGSGRYDGGESGSRGNQGWQNTISDIMNRIPMGGNGQRSQGGLPEVGLGPSNPQMAVGRGGWANENPNLGYALQQGRNEAIANQPWRAMGGPQNAGLDINPMYARKRPHSMELDW